MRQFISENEIKFNDLEKENSEIACKNARENMVEVEFKRTIYETKNELGEKTYIYLLDEAIGLETFGKVSTYIAFKIAEHVSISSFRNSAHNISSTTGQSISHGGVWNVVQSLGVKLKEIEDKDTSLVTNGQITGTNETKILFEEADGV